MYEQNTSMMNTPERNTFLLPAMVEGDFSSDEIAEDADGLQMMSFQRVKIPAGGALQFEIPTEDPDNPDYARTLEGVILYNHSAYTLWPEGSEYDEDTKPLCSSVDGKTGIGEPGGACATCPMNAYGSARDGGRGKACKNMRDIYLLRSGEYMPLLISLPPTSIKPFKEFLNRAFVYRRRATYGSLIQIGLKKENNGSNDYSVATFRLVRDFQGEELAQIRAYANGFKEQIKAINKEMGREDDPQAEIAELEQMLKAKNMPEEAREKGMSELKKLRMMAPASAEYAIVRNYVDWILELPWNDMRETSIDIPEARAILDADHFGLEKPKQRILEFLAVQKLTNALKGPILCLVGPPGVGKTSLARSVATATGREYVRLSLGGVRDEAEIRGHRRTYVGAMPGKIIMALKRAKSSNPLFCLDEIDKMSSDYRGDPASALLEVLDPEQNKTFNDHYLDIDYDLSKVFFITTANSLHNIPAPLQDRMEIIELSSYLEVEKKHIARDFLLPRQIKEHGLKPGNISLPEETLTEVIRSYTREARGPQP